MRVNAEHGHLEALAAYLADHDAPCPNCSYNLRGLKSGTCPECGDPILLRAYPDAERLDDRTRTALYLRDHDLVCRGCKTNLRGSADGVCPGCGRIYVVRGLPSIEPLVKPAPPWGCLIALGVMGALLLIIVLLTAVLSR